MYIIYKGASGDHETVIIDRQLEDETPVQMVQRYIDNGLVADLPWAAWFEVPADFAEYGAEYLIPDWENKTCVINQTALTAAIASNVRSIRNKLLRESDWTQLPDIPEATKQLWQSYRQVLRDIPQQDGFPHTTVFPTPPT